MHPNFTALSEQIQRWIERGYYPGAGLVIARGDRVLLERYFGTYTPETEVFIASAGKWLAAAAIASVVDDGLLGWDARVAEWLPQFAGAAGQISLRQLLSHTSGLPPQQPPGRRSDDYQTLEESVAAIAALGLVDPPGARFRYGGLSMQVAGRMAELATGQRFEELFQHRIGRPLGLSHTRFTPVDPGPGRSPMLAGGARSSAGDYARFLSMIAAGGAFEGRRVLSAASLAALVADQVGAAAVAPGEFVERVHGARHTGVYGLGLWRERLDATGCAMRVSSPSWAGSYPWMDSEHALYGAFITHVDLNGPPWDGGFDPLYSSAVLAELAALGAELPSAR